MSELPKDFLKGWNVVVIDDEPDSLEVASYMLEFYGADIYTASNGADGLGVIKAVRPRFIITDLSMPIMDGWELITRLKRDPATAEIPIIALTAHAMIGDRERAIAAGFHNYLTKPLTASNFMRDLLNLLMDIPELARDLPH